MFSAHEVWNWKAVINFPKNELFGVNSWIFYCVVDKKIDDVKKRTQNCPVRLEWINSRRKLNYINKKWQFADFVKKFIFLQLESHSNCYSSCNCYKNKKNHEIFNIPTREPLYFTHHIHQIQFLVITNASNIQVKLDHWFINIVLLILKTDFLLWKQARLFWSSNKIL